MTEKRSSPPTLAERQRRLRGAGQSGESRRSATLGLGDPRHRRQPQTAEQADQAFDPRQFRVGPEQRLQIELVSGKVLRAAQSVTDLPPLAPTADVIDKINELMAALREAGSMEVD